MNDELLEDIILDHYGELSESDQRELKKRLEEEASAREWKADLSRVSDALDAIPVPSPPPEEFDALRERVWQEIGKDDENETAPVVPLWGSGWTRIAAAAVLLVVFGLGIWVESLRHPEADLALGEAMLELGDVHLAAGHLEKAEEAYRRAQAGGVASLKERKRLLSALKARDSAALVRFLAEHPEDRRLADLALAAYEGRRAGDFKEPELVEKMKRLGKNRVFVLEGPPEDRIVALNRVLERKEEHEAVQAYAFLTKGDLLTELDKPEEARAAYELVLSQYENLKAAEVARKRLARFKR